jgi:DNA-binding transcriptional LysR family regulator
VIPASYRDIPKRVTPAYASRQPLILEYQRATVGSLIGRWLEAGGATGRPVMEFDHVEAIKIVVASGLGMSFVDSLPGFCSEPAVAEHVVLRPLSPALQRTIGIVVRRDKPGDPALDVVRETLAELGQNDAPSAPSRVGRRRAPAATR